MDLCPTCTEKYEREEELRDPVIAVKPRAGRSTDFAYGIDFILRHRKQILALCSGPTESLIVSRAFEILDKEN